MKTALFLAVEKENFDIIRLLLSSGLIDLNIINKISMLKSSNKI